MCMGGVCVWCDTHLPTMDTTAGASLNCSFIWIGTLAASISCVNC